MKTQALQGKGGQNTGESALKMVKHPDTWYYSHLFLVQKEKRRMEAGDRSYSSQSHATLLP